jgi:ubiquinone/menaquinone biosynthesis C-methylase UbiE
VNLHELRDHWDRMGSIDPMEAILYRAGEKLGGRNIQEFFNTGEREINSALESILQSGITISRKKALDFGCGIGRLTQALARHFQEVSGVDIAPSMIALANQYNRHLDNCHYLLNESENLDILSDNTFDLIYSSITLQHMHPRYAKQYISEFIRILAPGGVLLFQIPNGPIVINGSGTVNLPGLLLRLIPKSVLDATYRKVRYGNRPRAESYWIRKDDMILFLRNEGVRILNVIETPGSILNDCRYLATKD